MGSRVLIVDDEVDFCKTLVKILQASGYSANYTSEPIEVEDLISKQDIHLLIMDIRMPGRGGLQILTSLRKKNSKIPIIMISGFASAENIVQAMKVGATSFYTKPIKIPALLEEIRTLISSTYTFDKDFNPLVSHPILTADTRMKKVLELAAKVAKTDVSVVITGESGTGKELVAQAIHEQSTRANGALVKLNCAAIPETLLESELFGHEKGAFTDAKVSRIGRFEQAEGGSIFLDEIGETSPQMQTKLLRVLQEKQFERVGSNLVRSLNVRFISATNRNLEDCVKLGSFRNDLYYRLSVVKLELPPLRQRISDIMLLANHFRNEFSKLYHKEIEEFDSDVEQMFLAHPWPGNVRELRNCVERAIIFTEGPVIRMDSLPMQYDEICHESSQEYRQLIETVHKEKILEALDKASGNKTAAANLLNITRRTLYNKLKTLGIPL